MKTGIDNLKKTTYSVMAVLLVANISLMEKANKAQTTELGFYGTSIGREWQAGTKYLSKADEIQLLRNTANKLQATQNELLEEIGRLESRVRAYESQTHLLTADQFQDSAQQSPER